MKGEITMSLLQKLAEKRSKKAKAERARRVPAMNERDRKAAALAAKEWDNFLNYDGDEQIPIDVSLL